MEDERLRNRYNELDDMLSTIGTGMLGLTLGCARCHDHKYDAIPARDYYRLLCALHSGDRAEVPLGTDEAKDARLSRLRPGTEADLAVPARRLLRSRVSRCNWASSAILTRDKSPEDYWKQARDRQPLARTAPISGGRWPIG